MRSLNVGNASIRCTFIGKLINEKFIHTSGQSNITDIFEKLTLSCMLCFFATEINFLIVHHQNWIHRISHIDDCKTDTKNWYESQGNTKNRENPVGEMLTDVLQRTPHPVLWKGVKKASSP